ncbi:hypothetical protein Goari_018553, partial [Gossypium aridum]|nr:hypothetical protein [Gossypium aridum]
MTSRKRSGWQFFRICVKRTFDGKPRSCFQMRFCIDAVILIGFFYMKFGELLVMPRCDGYKKKIQKKSNAWNQTRQMKRLAMGTMTTPEYNDCWTDYKKLRLSMRTVGLGKTSEQWSEEIREGKNKVDSRERKFREVQTRNEALEKSLLENQKEKGEQENRVTELEGSLHRHRNQNSMIELRASL